MKINKSQLTIAGIIIIGSLLRFYNLTAISLWHDEAFSALLIRYPLGEMMHRIALDVHPPLYYLVLRVWDIVLGDSLLSLRFFSAFFGILTIYFAYLFIRDAFKNEKLAFIAAALIAFNPFQIQYSVEARMYTFGTFLVVLSSWLLVKALETTPEQMFGPNPSKKIITVIKKYKWWILYGLSAAAAIYTHYYLIFAVAAQGLFILFFLLKKYYKDIPALGKDESLRGAILAYLMAFILFIPWIGTFIKQLNQVDANYWIPAMDRYSVPNTIFHLFAGSNIYTDSTKLIIFSLIFLAIFIYAMKKENNNYKWLVAFSFIIPFTIAVILSFKRSLYLDRYFVFTGLFYCMIIAIFIESLKNKFVQKAFFALLVLSSILLFARSWQNMSPSGKPGMAEASKYIFDNAAPNEKVYVTSSFIFFTYKYYAYQYYYQGGYPSDFNPSEMKLENNLFAGERFYPNYLTPLLYSTGEIPHFSGTALLTDADLLNDFKKDMRRGENIWILWTTGFGGSKPDKLPPNWKQIDEVRYQDVFDYKGWIYATKYRVQ